MTAAHRLAPTRMAPHRSAPILADRHKLKLLVMRLGLLGRLVPWETQARRL